MQFSACVEWLFAAEAPAIPDRIRRAKSAGLDAVEFWRHSNKDLDAVRAALDETGLPLAGILCEPIAALGNPETHQWFLEGVRSSLAAARQLGAGVMIAQSGDDLHDIARPLQHKAIVDVLREAGRILDGSGVTLAIEPLNDRVDHAGYYLTSTTEGLDIVDEVGRPEVKLLYDIYHAAVMGEDVDLLAGRVDRVAHVHLADTPGRGAPGTGKLDYVERLGWLQANGYTGLVGLEYKLSGSTEKSLAFRESLA